ncbi:MAG: hypothetical protein KAG66_04690, partial [Methylococcales bacterium]|nr:hypothetical protein [Methylococcales bacterium]
IICPTCSKSDSEPVLEMPNRTNSDDALEMIAEQLIAEQQNILTAKVNGLPTTPTEPILVLSEVDAQIEAELAAARAEIAQQLANRQTEATTDKQDEADKAATLSGDGVVKRSTYVLGGSVAVEVSGQADSASNGVFYMHGDHLGSLLLISYGFDPLGAEGVGDLVEGSGARYLPFGGLRQG